VDCICSSEGQQILTLHPRSARDANEKCRLFTLRRRQSLQESGITHILSVLRLPLDQELFRGFTHKVIEVDDFDDENLLEHFPACIQFIQDGLDTGGGVLVHW
jgi:dual specificity phosphatase 12